MTKRKPRTKRKENKITKFLMTMAIYALIIATGMLLVIPVFVIIGYFANSNSLLAIGLALVYLVVIVSAIETIFR